MFDPTIYSLHPLTSTSAKLPITPGNNFDLSDSNVIVKQNSLPPEDVNDLKTNFTHQSQQLISSSETEDPQRKLNIENTESGNTSPNPKLVRKISRFLVSPVIVQGATNSIESENEKISIEQEQQIVSENSTSANSSPLSHFDIIPDQLPQLLSMSPAVHSNSGQSVVPCLNESTPVSQSQNCSSNILSTEGDVNSESSSRSRMGPEIVNTLEQLKIELENITHAHVQTVKVAKDNFANQSSNVDPLSRNSLATQNSISEATQTSSANTVGSLASLEEYKNYPVMEDASFHPSSDIPPANEYGQEAATSISDSTNAYNLSQNTSVYNSRRTSTDLDSNVVDHLECKLLEQKLVHLSSPADIVQGSPVSTLEPITFLTNTISSPAASSPHIERADQPFIFQNIKNPSNILTQSPMPLQQHQTVSHQLCQNINQQSVTQHQIQTQQQGYPNLIQAQPPLQNTLQQQHQPSIALQQNQQSVPMLNFQQQMPSVQHHQSQPQQALVNNQQNNMQQLQQNIISQPQTLPPLGRQLQQIIETGVSSNCNVSNSSYANVLQSNNLALNIQPALIPSNTIQYPSNTNVQGSQLKISNIVDLEHELLKLHQKKSINEQSTAVNAINNSGTSTATPPLQLTPNIDSPCMVMPFDNLSNPVPISSAQAKPQTSVNSRFKVSMVSDCQTLNNGEQSQSQAQLIERSCSLSSSSSSTSSNVSSSSSSMHSSITSNIRKPSTEQQMMENVDGFENINISTSINPQPQQPRDYPDMLLLPESIKMNVKQMRNDLNTIMRATNDPATRHGIQLLIQRQLLEEQELILKHHKELENFIKTVKGTFYFFLANYLFKQIN